MFQPNRNPRLVGLPEQDAVPFSVSAPSFFVIAGHYRCWKCGQDTEIYALCVVPPYQRLASFDAWQEGQVPAVLTYIEAVPGPIADILAQHAPRFFRDESQWHQRPYWMNHCPHCSAKIGDFEAVDSPSAPFNPTKIEVSKLRFSVITGRFEAAAILNPCPGKNFPIS